jgi:hypothetical protein
MPFVTNTAQAEYLIGQRDFREIQQREKQAKKLGDADAVKRGRVLYDCGLTYFKLGYLKQSIAALETAEPDLETSKMVSGTEESFTRLHALYNTLGTLYAMTDQTDKQEATRQCTRDITAEEIRHFGHPLFEQSVELGTA